MLSRRSFLKTGAAAITSVVAPYPASAEPRVILNDASRLNPTPVIRHVHLKSPALSDLVARVRLELKDAAADRRPVAVGVARHSMGGQSLPRNGTAITLEGAPIELDTVAKTYRTGCGGALGGCDPRA
jgi:hypothetical protein